MKINAKYFGEITYEENEPINIINGLFGFESYTTYLPIPFSEEDYSLISLQSLEDESLSFILMNPFMIYPKYSPEIPEQELRELGADTADDLSFYVISVIRDSANESTVNLKAPLVVNAMNRKAKQIMLNQPEYTFRHTLGDMIQKEEG